MLHAEPFETKLLSAELCILFIYFLKGNCIGLEYHIILSKIHIIVIIKTKIIDQNKSCSNNKLWKNRKPNISYFHPFGCVCFILNTKDHLGKFDSKAQKCFLLGYSEHSKGYRVYNTETLVVEESINIRFDDKLGLEKPKQFENFADTDIVISEAEEPRSKVPEAESLRSNGSEDQVAASL